MKAITSKKRRRRPFSSISANLVSRKTTHFASTSTVASSSTASSWPELTDENLAILPRVTTTTATATEKALPAKKKPAAKKSVVQRKGNNGEQSKKGKTPVSDKTPRISNCALGKQIKTVADLILTKFHKDETPALTLCDAPECESVLITAATTKAETNVTPSTEKSDPVKQSSLSPLDIALLREVASRGRQISSTSTSLESVGLRKDNKAENREPVKVHNTQQYDSLVDMAGESPMSPHIQNIRSDRKKRSSPRSSTEPYNALLTINKSLIHEGAVASNEELTNEVLTEESIKIPSVRGRKRSAKQSHTCASQSTDLLEDQASNKRNAIHVNEMSVFDNGTMKRNRQTPHKRGKGVLTTHIESDHMTSSQVTHGTELLKERENSTVTTKQLAVQEIAEGGAFYGSNNNLNDDQVASSRRSNSNNRSNESEKMTTIEITTHAITDTTITSSSKKVAMLNHIDLLNSAAPHKLTDSLVSHRIGNPENTIHSNMNSKSERDEYKKKSYTLSESDTGSSKKISQPDEIASSMPSHRIESSKKLDRVSDGLKHSATHEVFVDSGEGEGHSQIDTFTEINDHKVTKRNRTRSKGSSKKQPKTGIATRVIDPSDGSCNALSTHFDSPNSTELLNLDKAECADTNAPNRHKTHDINVTNCTMDSTPHSPSNEVTVLMMSKPSQVSIIQKEQNDTSRQLQSEFRTTSHGETAITSSLSKKALKNRESVHRRTSSIHREKSRTATTPPTETPLLQPITAKTLDAFRKLAPDNFDVMQAMLASAAPTDASPLFLVPAEISRIDSCKSLDGSEVTFEELEADDDNASLTTMADCPRTVDTKRVHVQQVNETLLSKGEVSTLVSTTSSARRKRMNKRSRLDPFVDEESDGDDCMYRHPCAEISRVLSEEFEIEQELKPCLTSEKATVPSSPRTNDSALLASTSNSEKEVPLWTAELANRSNNIFEFCLKDGRRFRHPPLPSGWSIGISRSRNIPYYRHPDFGRSYHPPIPLPSEDGHIRGVLRTIASSAASASVCSKETTLSPANSSSMASTNSLESSNLRCDAASTSISVEQCTPDGAENTEDVGLADHSPAFSASKNSKSMYDRPLDSADCPSHDIIEMNNSISGSDINSSSPIISPTPTPGGETCYSLPLLASTPVLADQYSSTPTTVEQVEVLQCKRRSDTKMKPIVKSDEYNEQQNDRNMMDEDFVTPTNNSQFKATKNLAKNLTSSSNIELGSGEQSQAIPELCIRSSNSQLAVSVIHSDNHAHNGFSKPSASTDKSNVSPDDNQIGNDMEQSHMDDTNEQTGGYYMEQTPNPSSPQKYREIGDQRCDKSKSHTDKERFDHPLSGDFIVFDSQHREKEMNRSYSTFFMDNESFSQHSVDDKSLHSVCNESQASCLSRASRISHRSLHPPMPVCSLQCLEVLPRHKREERRKRDRKRKQSMRKADSARASKRRSVSHSRAFQ
jgi:hypothetical protein